MKQYFLPWTDGKLFTAIIFCLLSGLVLIFTGCVSQAKAVDSDDTTTTQDEAVVPEAAVVVPELEETLVDVADFFRRVPAAASLYLPALPEPFIALPDRPQITPESFLEAGSSIIDVTVLSPAQPRVQALLPEPLPIPVPAPAAAPVTTTAPPAPKPVAPPTSAPPATTPPASAATTPRDAPAAAAPAVVPPVAPETKPVEQFRLPVPPPSSARQVSPVEAPVAMIEVEAVRSQRFDIRFRGSGWAYLGDEDGQEGIRFETRRFENNDVYFTLNPAQEGDYILRFRRQNPLNQQMESSLVRVKVRSPAEISSTRRLDDQAAVDIQVFPLGQLAGAALATGTTPAGTTPAGTTPAGTTPAGTPSSTAAQAGVQSGAQPGAQPAQAGPIGAAANTGPTPAAATGETETVAGAPVSAAPIISAPAVGTPENPAGRPDGNPAALLAWAKSELGAGRVQPALAALDRYVQLYASGNDELYYLYGLAYEQDTPFRNIKLAHENYKRVRDEYPRSLFRRQAIERIAWMERHFFGLR